MQIMRTELASLRAEILVLVSAELQWSLGWKARARQQSKYKPIHSRSLLRSPRRQQQADRGRAMAEAYGCHLQTAVTSFCGQ